MLGSHVTLWVIHDPLPLAHASLQPSLSGQYLQQNGFLGLDSKNKLGLRPGAADPRTKKSTDMAWLVQLG